MWSVPRGCGDDPENRLLDLLVVTCSPRCGDDVGSFRISSASPFDSTGLSWKTIFAMCIENVMGTYLCSFP